VAQEIGTFFVGSVCIRMRLAKISNDPQSFLQHAGGKIMRGNHLERPLVRLRRLTVVAPHQAVSSNSSRIEDKSKSS